MNWKRFGTLFGLYCIAMFMVGCGWVSAINGFWPAITTAIGALLSFLGSVTTIPDSVKTTVAKIEAGIQTALQEGTALLATLGQNTAATVVQDFQTVLTFISSNLNAILTAINVVDPGTVSIATKFVQAAIVAIEAILAILPLTKLAETATKEQLEAADKVATSNLKSAHKQLQTEYHNIVNTPTGDVPVDVALAALPKQLP